MYIYSDIFIVIQNILLLLVVRNSGLNNIAVIGLNLQLRTILYVYDGTIIINKCEKGHA